MYEEKSKVVNIIDILAAILRYRKVGIFLFTLLVLFNLVMVYIVPSKTFNNVWQKKSYTAEAVIPVVELPNDVERSMSFSPIEIMLNKLGSVKFISNVYRPFSSINYQEDDTLLENYVATKILTKALTVSFDKYAKLLTIKYRTNDKEKSKLFLKRLLLELHKEFREEYNIELPKALLEIDLLRENINRNLEMMIENAVEASVTGVDIDTDELIKKLDLEHIKLAGYSNLEANKEYMSTIIKNEKFPWDPSTPVVIKTASAKFNQNEYFVILILLSLLLTLVVIFILEYVRNIRNNEIEMAKIKSALKR